MASILVTPSAREDLWTLIHTHSLPPSTVGRVRRSIEPLREFPELGGQLHGRWASFRFVLGPWRWMIIVYYYYDAEADVVAIVTIQDGRAASGARTSP